MKTDERKLANKIADYWYNGLHMQHKPIFQKQKLADYVESELKTLGLFSVSNRRELLINFLNYHLENDLDGTEANWIGKTVDNFLKINN